MKNVDEHYKDWSGRSHVENSCEPVHDSAECTDFAEYYHKAMRIIERTDEEMLYIKHTIALLSSMIKCGEEHSKQSYEWISKSIAILTKK